MRECHSTPIASARAIDDDAGSITRKGLGVELDELLAGNVLRAGC